jgi:hypothetical protein
VLVRCGETCESPAAQECRESRTAKANPSLTPTRLGLARAEATNPTNMVATVEGKSPKWSRGVGVEALEVIRSAQVARNEIDQRLVTMLNRDVQQPVSSAMALGALALLVQCRIRARLGILGI